MAQPSSTRPLEHTHDVTCSLCRIVGQNERSEVKMMDWN